MTQDIERRLAGALNQRRVLGERDPDLDRLRTRVLAGEYLRTHVGRRWYDAETSGWFARRYQ